MYQILFVIHGMGAGARPANDPTWWKSVVDSLGGYARRFQLDKRLVLQNPKADDVLVVPLTYHNVFDDVRTKWTATGPDAGWAPLLMQLNGIDPAIGPKLPGWAASAGEFFWTHALDVLLYRYVNEFRAPIRNAVEQQISAAWLAADAANGAPTRVHFLAHSLGTSVIHDSLASLATNPAFAAGVRRIGTVMTCANVSRVLETNFPIYSSPNRPSNAPPAPGGMADVHGMFAHDLDPIPAVKAFDRAASGWPAAGLFHQMLDDVKDWNVHGYTHYLDNPAAHLWLFGRLWPNEPWNTRMAPAIAQYKAAPGNPCAAGIAIARTKLKAIFAAGLPNTLDGYMDVLVRVLAVLREAKAACP